MNVYDSKKPPIFIVDPEFELIDQIVKVGDSLMYEIGLPPLPPGFDVDIELEVGYT